MPSSACVGCRLALHSFPTRRSSDLVAIDFGLPVAVFSMEMSGEQVAMRMLGSIARVSQHKIRTGRVEEDDWSRVTKGLEKLQAASIDRKSTRLNSSHLGISYAVFCLRRLSPCFTLFPYTTLFRSRRHRFRPAGGGVQHGNERRAGGDADARIDRAGEPAQDPHRARGGRRLEPGHQGAGEAAGSQHRSEEHTSELQSLRHLVCRLLLASAVALLYTLSLHDALPISSPSISACRWRCSAWK